MKFKLQKLVVRLPFGMVSMQHFEVFLKTQTDTLAALEIDSQLSQAFLELVLGLPKLMSLKISSISGEIQELPVSNTIAFLQVFGGITAGDGDTEQQRFAYQTLIGALRNLKHLKCKEIDNELFLFLALVVSHLRIIETLYFNVPRVPERNFFPNIKEFKADRFCQHLRETTADYNFAKLVRKEMRKML